MLRIDYLLLRLIRRVAPSAMIRLAMQKEWGIRPGLETRSPVEARDRYMHALKERGKNLRGSTILVVGYGGSFGFGALLLQAGADHVILQDPYVPQNRNVNRRIARMNEEFVRIEHGRPVPNPRWITVVEDDVSMLLELDRAVDIVLSSSVFEHIQDPPAVAKALSQIVEPDGLNLHIIDLRDHMFKYPFEMLCYDEVAWRRYLNPPDHLNRLRAWDYTTIFQKHFKELESQILESEVEAFRRARHRIRAEFVSGNLNVDAATKIMIKASSPRD